MGLLGVVVCCDSLVWCAVIALCGDSSDVWGGGFERLSLLSMQYSATIKINTPQQQKYVTSTTLRHNNKNMSEQQYVTTTTTTEDSGQVVQLARENERLMRKLSEMLELLDARERKVGGGGEREEGGRGRGERGRWEGEGRERKVGGGGEREEGGRGRGERGRWEGEGRERKVGEEKKARGKEKDGFMKHYCHFWLRSPSHFQTPSNTTTSHPRLRCSS